MEVQDLETLETFGGNNNSPKVSTKSVKSDDKSENGNKNRIVPSKFWCFTSFGDDIEIMKDALPVTGNIKFIYGNEVCPTTQRPHLQGYLESEIKIRPIEKFGTSSTNWEKAKGDRAANIAYCSKEGKYVTNFVMRRPVLDPMQGKKLKDWQVGINNLLDTEPDGRKIYVFVDIKGGCGKSTFAKHLAMKRNSLIVGGKSADVKYAIAERLKTEDVPIVIWDLPRSIGDMVNYQSIEEVKNGAFFSSKYESGMVIFNTPHLIIFTNSMPDLSKLSMDRWVINVINEQ